MSVDPIHTENVSVKSNSAKTRRMDLAGFSLVEVLIALVIMSVGMLGIAGLYVHTMQAGRTSLFRHHAITLAGDIADRIRANPLAGVGYIVAGVDNNCVDGGIDCNAAEMAQQDIFGWTRQATATLPAGTVNIVFNNGIVPSTYQITVSWNEPGETPQYRITIPVFGI